MQLFPHVSTKPRSLPISAEHNTIAACSRSSWLCNSTQLPRSRVFFFVSNGEEVSSLSLTLSPNPRPKPCLNHRESYVLTYSPCSLRCCCRYTPSFLRPREPSTSGASSSGSGTRTPSTSPRRTTRTGCGHRDPWPTASSTRTPQQRSRSRGTQRCVRWRWWVTVIAISAVARGSWWMKWGRIVLRSGFSPVCLGHRQEGSWSVRWHAREFSRRVVGGALHPTDYNARFFCFVPAESSGNRLAPATAR